ncbi:MAG: hypothetical protein HYX40_06400 [Sphingobacteriales bacterium]|nr:hypothetical protein [Sphingobacteriales bacterium]
MKLVLLIIGVYILYRFVFGFVFPVISATKQMKRKMQEFHQQQEGVFSKHTTNTASTANKNYRAPSDDYLEFEEVK